MGDWAVTPSLRVGLERGITGLLDPIFQGKLKEVKEKGLASESQRSEAE